MPTEAAFSGTPDPDGTTAEASLGRALELRRKGLPLEALIELQAIIRRHPDSAEAHHQKGNILKSLFRFAEARASLGEAARLAPQNAAIWLNLGVACLELRRLDESVDAFRRAIDLEPDRPEARNAFGTVLLQQGLVTEAAAQFEKALQLRPGYAAAHDNMGRVMKAQGRSAEALACHRAALEREPKATTHSNLLYTLNFVEGLPPEEILAEHRRWAELYAGPHGPEWRPVPLRPAQEPGRRKLRVGYVSPDFCNHAVAFFFEPVLSSHDRERFETVCYSDTRVPDQVTGRLRSHAWQWRNIAGWSDDLADALIRSDRIDILVDLAGHTAHNRLSVFGGRPAPVQVSWLGYPNTTGLPAIGYRLTDAVCDPPGLTERWHTEALVRLPQGFSCYLPPAESPPVGPLPALSAGHVTFGCFNHVAKLTPAAVELWAGILGDLPGSRLMLKSRGLTDPGTIARIRNEFEGRGVAGGRIELRGEDLPTAGHLGLYNRVDIALDTFPYNGTTTTCEALWMGVPVVALAGDTHVARVSASLLTRLGAADLIAASAEDYRSLCLALAADLPRLAERRALQRDRMRASPICDAAGFTRGLEEAYLRMWAGRPSESEGRPAEAQRA
jgi:predicted O-linked N-acetylglucosamine transferase (SPINDLY family)